MSQNEPADTPRDCPFCGHYPLLRPVDDKDAQRSGSCWGRVACMNKLCPAQPSVEDGEKVNDDRGWRAYRDAAVRRWNQRA